jgi:hypothetical protein
MKVQHLDAAYLHLHWDVIEKHLQPAIKMADVEDYTLDQLKVFLINKQWQIFVAVENNQIEGCAVVSFSNMPNTRIAFVTLIGGKFIGNKDTLNHFNALLKSMGATKIQGYARESVARLWKRIGFENKQILVEYRL